MRPSATSRGGPSPQRRSGAPMPEATPMMLAARRALRVTGEEMRAATPVGPGVAAARSGRWLDLDAEQLGGRLPEHHALFPVVEVRALEDMIHRLGLPW